MTVARTLPLVEDNAGGSTRRLRREVVPSSALGMLIFVGTEVMFFAGLISAFTISRAGALPGTWTLPRGLTLPAETTAINTTALLLSGLLVWKAGRQFRRRQATARPTLLAGVILGAVFVLFQGQEWARLLGQGITVRTQGLAAFFYLIVGTHAVHAIAALLGLMAAWWKLRAGRLSPGFLLGAEIFWYFVVAIWPVIYARVYF